MQKLTATAVKQAKPKTKPYKLADGGGLYWKANGLQVPDSLTRATNAYRDEQDLLLDWMNEECELAPNLETEKLTLFTAYKRWCEDCSYRNLSKGSFSRKLTGRGYKVTSDKRRWIGIGLKNPLSAGLR